MKYYLVKCKFGHVGRNKYLPIVIPVIANSVKEASKYARHTGGVKKDHKDWCLEEPKEVDIIEYRQAKVTFDSDIYFEKHSRSRLYLFKNRLVKEKNYHRLNGIKTNKKTYVKKRNKSIIEYKCKRQEEIVKSKVNEQIMALENYFMQPEILMGRE